MIVIIFINIHDENRQIKCSEFRSLTENYSKNEAIASYYNHCAVIKYTMKETGYNKKMNK
jgi:hypothetical protein